MIGGIITANVHGHQCICKFTTHNIITTFCICSTIRQLNNFLSAYYIEGMKSEKNIVYGPVRKAVQDNLCLGEIILNQMRLHGSTVAQVNAYTGEERTYKEILNDSQCLAAYLSNVGCKENDRLVICSENNLEFCVPLCAALYLGLTVCPINPMYTKTELKHSLSITRPKYIFTSVIAANNVRSVLSEIQWLPKIILLTDADDIKLPSMNDLITTVNKTDRNNVQVHKVDINNHVSAILCSSGTTGLPKGVMLTDKNFIAMIQDMTDPAVNILTNDTVTLSLLPYFHAYSFASLINRFVVGVKSIVMSRFDEKIFLQVIQNYKIQYLAIVPPLMLFLAKHPLVSKYDLSSLKIIWCGAAPLAEEIQKAVADRLGVNIKQGYGLTETTLAVLRVTQDINKYGSVGTVAPGHLAKVIPLDGNKADEPLGPNCVGQLCFKGDLIMKGYYNDEKATKETIDEDGWLHTGDIGYYDNEGYFYIIDRMKELIKYKGFQVPPAELEAILLTCPGVKDAAVIGVPNEDAGEVPLAFVVKDENSNVTEKQIISYVNARTSIHKRLRGGVQFINEIPKTASGKILRRKLRTMVKSKL